MKRILRIVFLAFLAITGLETTSYAQDLDSAARAEAEQQRFTDSLERAGALGLYQLFKDIAEEDPDIAKVLVRDNFAQAADILVDNAEVNFAAGTYYLGTESRYKAIPYLERVRAVDPDYEEDLLFLLGRAYHFGGQFEQAIQYYEAFEDFILENPQAAARASAGANRVQVHINECMNGIKFRDNPIGYQVEIVSAVNSEGYDYAPVIDEQETIMVFTSRRQAGNIGADVDRDNFYFEDIFIASKNGEDWGYPENIGEPVNNEFHDSNLAISADGNTLFKYGDENSGDILFSEKQADGTWSEPQEVPGLNSPYKENSVSISQDGQVIFFSSDRPGHQGIEANMDIYYARRLPSGEWGKPRNLGPNVNSDRQDEGPFIDYNGKTLYFSSDGWDTMGEHDIFKTEYDSATGEWSTPVNMGYPLNTPDDDIYFVATRDGKRGYYASVREGGLGYTDIYEVSIPDAIGQMSEVGPVGTNGLTTATNRRPEDVTGDINTVELQEVPTLKGIMVTMKIVDNNTGGVINANPTLQLIEGSETFPATNPSTGIYSWAISPDGVDEGSYQLVVEADGYESSQFRFKLEAFTTEPQEVKRQIALIPLETNTPATADNGNPTGDSNPNGRDGNPTSGNANLRGVVLTYRIFDASTRRPLDADVALITEDQSRTLTATRIGEGVYQWNLDPSLAGTERLYLNAVAPEYNLKTRRVRLPEFTTEAQQIQDRLDLSPIRIGESNVLQYIFFEFNKATFTAESYSQLEAVKRYLDINNVSIVLAGHTDNIGERAFNKDLSKRRAKAIYDYLVGQGINANRMSYVGFGEDKPLVSNDDEEEGREINRRVEFTVVESTARNN